MFSAWVLHHSEKKAEPFNWRLSGWQLGVPMINGLFNRIAQPGPLTRLNLVEVLGWAADMLNRVNPDEFFTRFEQEEAIQYFYEPFLEAFDEVLRKDLGVWYTPREVVQYMVKRVDTVLRTELNLPKGLADSRVVILDPCCGTGAFLVEAAKLIGDRLAEDGDAFAADDLREALMHRVFGFEIMPAPFVVAHLQLGLLLQRRNAQLREGERAGVYLTNALTGWEPLKNPKQLLAFPELQEERDAAGLVKREQRILVVLGNPPYNAFAGVSAKEENDIIKVYKEGLREVWGIKKYNLDELYARFFRLAERRIAEFSGEGVVCFVSSFSYLRDSSYVVMRQRLLSEFDSIWIDCLNGDSRETGKRTSDGQSDPSIFSTPQNKEGIRKGAAIGLFVRKTHHSPVQTLLFKHYWGKTKRKDLHDSLQLGDFDATYQPVLLSRESWFSFYPKAISQSYLDWPMLTELAEDMPFQGLDEDRQGDLIAINKEPLAERMRQYFDKKSNSKDLKRSLTGLLTNSSGFDYEKVRENAQRKENFNHQGIRRYAVRPFDERWCYYTQAPNVWKRSRPSLAEQVWEGNIFLLSRDTRKSQPEGLPFFLSDHFFARDSLKGHAVAFPIWLKEKQYTTDPLFAHLATEIIRANLSVTARSYLHKLGFEEPDGNAEVAGLLWYHALAIGYSTAYQTENADGIGQDFPRIPLPADRSVLEQSAQTGRQIAALLLPEQDVPGVTTQLLPYQKSIAAITFRTSDHDLAVRGNWGYRTDDNKVMPGGGRFEPRNYSPAEQQAFADSGFDDATVAILFGTTTYDVYLNENTLLVNVPARVWQFVIGGYQIMKKWLSYREESVLGRALTKEEVRELVNTARRLTGLSALEPTLNANYQEVKEKTSQTQSITTP